MPVSFRVLRQRHFRHLIAGLAGCLAAGEICAAMVANADCDMSGFQKTLIAPSPQLPALAAEAIWLDQRLITWPGVKGGGAFRLHRSATGGIVAMNGIAVTGADAAIALNAATEALPAELAARFRYLADGVVLTLPRGQGFDDMPAIAALHQQQLVLVQEDAEGRVQRATRVQAAAALDSLYRAAASVPDLGASVAAGTTGFKLWAPTAIRVELCLYPSGQGTANQSFALQMQPASGVWSAQRPADLSGDYYTYLVDVLVPGAGLVRNRVTDPYSLSLTTDSARSYIADLAAARSKPRGWDRAVRPRPLASATDMVIYELHVRDFSINDPSVATPLRGKYLAFTQGNSNGMKHLAALAGAGLTDVHLLPVFDLASVPESGCVTPVVRGGGAGETQQATIAATRERDCFNWGYDPWHYTAPEGSYATAAADGAARIVEFRRMVQALHAAGLRVGMDVVYNHTAASGQQQKSLLDRIVPGYYHRLDAAGKVETSTCCDNTATEHMMMEKLMFDSVLTWAVHYRIDSFRFDLMGHQPRAAMERLRAALRAATGRDIALIGEGWNFGEVADGKRFVQASQLSLAGSGIGTFSDRARDAVRGGGPADSGADLMRRQGYVNGLGYDRNAEVPAERTETDLRRELMGAADMVRVGLAGSIRDYPLTTWRDELLPLARVDYHGQPAGYAAGPDEVVNYVENHDNQTLFDINVFKLPLTTTRTDRARVQILGAAINAFSQGIAYFHAGIDTLRSKSLDRNSYDSGDWFNRLDWGYRDNYFGTGAPPRQDNGKDYALIKPLLADGSIRPRPADIAWTRDAFRDLLRIRASSTLFRLRSAADIRARLSFPNSGGAQVPTVLVGRLDGAGYPGANFRELIYLINVDTAARKIVVAEARQKSFILHPVHRAATAADRRVAQSARYLPASGSFEIPARTAAVFVVP